LCIMNFLLKVRQSRFLSGGSETSVWRKQPEIWTAGSWLLHHDNARAHTALSIRQFLAKHSIPTLSQPPYSPDLSPSNFFLFPKLKITLKGRRVQTVGDIITNAMNDLKAIPQTSFEQCFQKWRMWWERCIAVQGAILKGIIFSKL
jgi:histone-lysine N-methyltransferase SETMAR